VVAYLFLMDGACLWWASTPAPLFSFMDDLVLEMDDH